MASLAEALAGQQPQLAATLDAGLNTLSQNQTITFVQYVQKVLPIDGYVFWIRGDLVGQPLTFSAKGSLHHRTELHQDETRSFSTNAIVFTSETEVQNLNRVGPTTIFIATVGPMQFAFSARGGFYKQADLWHYTGASVQSDMLPQVINTLADFDGRGVVVSNSLPIWLSLNNYNPPYPGFGNTIPLYPSFLSPVNFAPPYGAVHIPPDSTRAIAAAPNYDARMTSQQLVQERVEITLFGVRNNDAQDFVACVEQFSIDWGTLGLMNMPVLRDEKRVQVEIAALAQKKVIEFEVNYNQHRVRDVARQMLLSAIPSFDVISANFPFL